MRKIIYSAIGAMIICSAISAFAISGQSHKNNEMLNSNVEALASGEDDLGLNVKQWWVFHRDDGGYNCNKGGSEACSD